MPKGLLRSGFVPLLLATACAGEPRHATTANAPSPDPAPRRWPRFAEVEAWAPSNESPFATRGHLVKPSHALVRVSPSARESYLGLVTDTVFSEGSVIAMFHQSRDGAEKGPVYVMEKKENAWTFLALEADGAIVSENLGVCALCHRGGVADHVFGLPRSWVSPGGAGARD